MEAFYFIEGLIIGFAIGGYFYKQYKGIKWKMR